MAWKNATDKINGPSFERVRELFDYDQKTGHVTRRITVNARAKKGTTVGCRNSTDGYLVLNIDHSVHKRLFQLHRIIWLWMTGEWPKCQIDHINRIRDDNRWENLREATNGQNTINQAVRKDNKLGCKGIWYDKKRDQYRVKIQVKGYEYTIGRYDTFEEAKEWRKLAEEEFYGEFAKGK